MWLLLSPTTEVVLQAGDGLNRAPVQPVPPGDVDLDGFADRKEFRGPLIREVALDVDPERSVFRSIIYDQDDRIEFGKPEFQVTAAHRPLDQRTRAAIEKTEADCFSFFFR